MKIYLLLIIALMLFLLYQQDTETKTLKQENVQLQKELNERNNYLELVRALRK